MKKAKRFQAGFLGSCICHMILVILFGLLGLWTITKDNKDDIMVVSLVGGGGGSIQSVQQEVGSVEKIAARPDDIVEISKKPEKTEQLKQERLNNSVEKSGEKSSANNGGSGNNGESEGKGKGTGSIGAGFGNGSDNAQPVVPPRLIHYSKPPYPSAAREKGIEGTVIVRVLIDLSGNIAGADVYESSGSSLLDEAAIAATNRWEFSAAKNNLGKNMACYIFIPISFNLR
ncbi:MAG: energy transducer TonB [Negativicutes bacterium]|nr:energy transducer TonB [Negativicutes bacterium]